MTHDQLLKAAREPGLCTTAQLDAAEAFLSEFQERQATRLPMCHGYMTHVRSKI